MGDERGSVKVIRVQSNVFSGVIGCVSATVFAGFFSLCMAGCEYESSRPAQAPQQPPPQGYYPGAPPPPYGAPPPGYAPPPGQANQPPQYQPPPNQAPPQQAPPQQLPAVASDPINDVNIAFLRGRSQIVIRELISALTGTNQQRVQNVPLAADDEVGEVNAYAACTRDGKALMAITDGLLEIEANLAQSKATDEIFGTRKVDEYVQFVARNQRPKQPVVKPPPGFYDPVQRADGRKVRRQHQLMDEQIAFVLGHELAHHYLGHLPCTASGPVNAGDVTRALSSAIPIFNQPNELAADVSGTNNVLSAGAKHQDYRWTEGGALLTMQFFGGLDQLTPTDIVFGFERTHPPPQLRTPVIQQSAATWRSTGGVGFTIPGF